jgi:hypothetical protein
LKSISLQACSYQGAFPKGFLTTLAAKYHHLNPTAKSARNMVILEVLADKHMQKFNVAFLAEFAWSAADISKALNKVYGNNALSMSQVHRISKAVRNDDETIFTDDLVNRTQHASDQSLAMRQTS